MTTFREIVTDDFIIKALDDLGYTNPTEIQEATIPFGLQGKDVIGQAKTGSGKTFAFGIPIMHGLTSERGIQSLILAPTRELCQQIAKELRKLAKHKRCRVVEVYGGVSINPQIDELRGAQVVVATPGRSLDHLERRTMDLRHVKFFVLDEADRMLDMGFIDDIREIMKQLPEDRQTLLFSATMPTEIKRLAIQYMREPEHVKTHSHIDDELLPQYYYVVERNMKFSLLTHLVEKEKIEKGLVFCATRHICDAVARNLERHGINAQPIHGGLSQARRNKILDDFSRGKLRLLVATDVAARGLHIPDVSHVFNYDVPKESENYIHRIGRTARAGKSGKAITLLEHRDFEFFQGVLNIVPTEPEQLEMPDIRSVGFRKHEDSAPRQGGFERSGPRGPRRDGPRQGGPKREGGPKRSGGSYGSGQRGGAGDTQAQRAARRARRGY